LGLDLLKVVFQEREPLLVVVVARGEAVVQLFDLALDLFKAGDLLMV
jgi:hypothetical protein